MYSEVLVLAQNSKIFDNHIDNHISDIDLIKRIQGGDDAAFETIASRYLGLIGSVASKYRNIGNYFDNSDFVQEGLLALLYACKNFDAKQGMSLKNYILLCVESRFKSIVRKVNKKSRVPQDVLLSISDDIDQISDTTQSSPDEIFESREYIEKVRNTLKDRLSPFEYSVVSLYLSGYTYSECSKKLSVSEKSVENALSRIRKKLSQ